MLRKNAKTDAFEFETDELKGVLQPAGRYHGLESLLHKPSGIEIVHPKYSVLNLFFLFSTNMKKGVPRGYEREPPRCSGMPDVVCMVVAWIMAQLRSLAQNIEMNMQQHGESQENLLRVAVVSDEWKPLQALLTFLEGRQRIVRRA